MSLIDSASLIVTPNAYSEGKLYSVIPSDGSGDMSVTRATTATRVNSAGLVELVPYNLLQYSEDLSNAYWTKQNGALTSNTIAAPNGTLTADTYTSNGGTTTADKSCLVRANIIPSDGIYTRSVYMKKGNTRYAWLSTFSTSFTDGNFFVFDFDTATISFTNNLSNRNIELKVEDAGNGWYRFIYVQDSLASGITYNISFGMSNASNSMENHNNGDFVYVWGAQLVEGSVALPYQKTETRLNIPRLDYSNGTCPSLLVEPQRTNLLTWSSSFDNAVYQKIRVTISSNTTTSPSGIQDADKLIENTDNNTHAILTPISNTSGQQYTVTIYAKADERNWFVIYVGGGPAQGRFFNLSNGTLGSALANTPNASSITDAGNGWYRCSITYTATDTSSDITILTAISDGVNSYLGNGTSGIYIWGAQLEAGSYATSYIPTTSASVTRNADVISKTGISSLIGQTEGTLFVDVDFKINSGEVGIFTEVTNGTSAQRVLIYYIGADILCYANTGVFSFTQPSNGRLKIAFGYKSGSSVLYINGVLINSSTASLSYSSLSQFNLGCNYQYGQVTSQPYNAAALWKTRLTNDELASLTTL